jgi:hypothetical protein
MIQKHLRRFVRIILAAQLAVPVRLVCLFISHLPQTQYDRTFDTTAFQYPRMVIRTAAAAFAILVIIMIIIPSKHGIIPLITMMIVLRMWM